MQKEETKGREGNKECPEPPPFGGLLARGNYNSARNSILFQVISDLNNMIVWFSRYRVGGRCPSLSDPLTSPSFVVLIESKAARDHDFWPSPRIKVLSTD